MDKNKLLALLAENGDTQSDLASAIGISRTRLSAKINERDNAAFTQPEIAAIKKRYSLSGEQVDAIFFALPVS
jgi:DNA-binding XRE family transcriptional regulator